MSKQLGVMALIVALTCQICTVIYPHVGISRTCSSTYRSLAAKNVSAQRCRDSSANQLLGRACRRRVRDAARPKGET